MHCRADLRERRIAFQAEALQQHLVGHAILDMRELGAVEIEADGALRALARAPEPGEFRLAVDEALDQPSARQAVDPEVGACGPDAPAVAAGAARAQLSLRRPRLAAGISFPIALLEPGKRCRRLRFRFAGKEVGPGNLVEQALQATHRRLRP